MMRVSRGFNTYLLVLLLLGLIGCASPDGTKKDKAGKITSDDKKYSLLRLHLETAPNATAPGQKIQVFRQAPFALNIKREPVLDEAYIMNAQVIETDHGFSIQVQYDDHGKLTLDMTSSGNRGRRLAIYSAFWPTGATNADDMHTIRKRVGIGDAMHTAAQGIELALLQLGFGAADGRRRPASHQIDPCSDGHE